MQRTRQTIRKLILTTPLSSLALILTVSVAQGTLIGDSVHLNVTIFDPPDTVMFDGDAVIDSAAIDFEFDDLALDISDTPKYVWDVDFTGPEGLTLVVTATRNTPINDINGHFRSFEFTGLDFGGSAILSDAILVGITGDNPGKWSGASITAFGDDFLTFETGSWNSSFVTQGNTIVATIQLVPEPSTALLLSGGLVGLAARRRRLN